MAAMSTSVKRIAKAKIKDGQLIVECEGHDKDTERHEVVKCAMDKVHPDLADRFNALPGSVREILEWPSNLYAGGIGKDGRDRIRVTGVSWSYSETTDVEGACIIVQVDLENSNSPLCLTTPHLPYDQYAEDGNQPVMPDGAQDALNALKAEVQAFLDGKRAQGDLFDEIGKAHGMNADVIKAARSLTEDGTTIEVITR
jgi:hypothetical protein